MQNQVGVMVQNWGINETALGFGVFKVSIVGLLYFESWPFFHLMNDAVIFKKLKHIFTKKLSAAELYFLTLT